LEILRALRQAEGGTRISDLCREHGISEATYYVWTAIGRRAPASPAIRSSSCR
jgi:transposase-like protein